MADTNEAPVVPLAVIKEGHVSVRGHFMWRDRYVVVEHGQVTIRRSGKGAIKAKIDLLDPAVRVVFHENTAQLTIHSNAHTTVFNCGSTHDRDEWVSALFTAKGGHGCDTDCEMSDLVMSSMEEFEKELSTRHALETASSSGSTAVQRDQQSSDEDGTEQEYNDTLLAFQDMRSSMMQCQRSLIDMEDNDDHVLKSQVEGQRSAVGPHMDETTVKQRNLQAIVAFIHATQHGGRAVLLHLDVIDSICGISIEEILSTIGDKHRDRPSSSSGAAGLQKLHIATFVRYILFHPVYAKRPEVQQRAAAIDALVDRHFPHCRLRRFSHDIEQGSSCHAFELDVSWQRKDSDHESTSTSPQQATRVMPMTMVKPDAAALKKKRHSFPNILLPLQIGPLSTYPSLARIENSSSYCTPLQAKRSASDHLTDHASVCVQNDSDLFNDELIPEPLRNVLWKFSCQQVAEQLSIFHQQQLGKLTLWEFVHSPKHEAKPVTEYFNRLVSYLVWSVLVEDTAKDRAEVIECIITIASTASTAPLNNFHLVMACVGCLGDTPLMPSRLPLTWKRVRSKFKTQLVALRTLCDHSGGFETLRKRQAIESSKGSCIPFIGVIGVTLERLRLVPYTDESVGLLDVDKLDRQYVAVSTIESAMLRPYKILELADLQQWMHVKMVAIDTFMSPRLLQLRSQQLLASETIQQSGSRHSSLYRPRNSPGSGANGGSDGITDGGPSLLPFREICSLLVSTDSVSERIEICVEALLADDQQPLNLRLRKFHQDFKQTACHSACHVVLANVRKCVDDLKRDLLAHKSFEIMQLTGLEDTSIQLERALYMTIHRAVTQPIATWLYTKMRYAFAEEDTRLYVLLDSANPTESSAAKRRQRSCTDYRTSLSPLDLLQALAEALEVAPESNDEAAGVQCCRQVLSTWTRTPFTVLCLLQQSLDVLFLPKELRDALDLLDIALSTLGTKRLSSRASMSMTCNSSRGHRGSRRCLSGLVPPERVVPVDILR